MTEISGYTLTELLIALMLSIILVVVALPVYRDLTSNNRKQTQVTQLVAAINFARSEAISRHSIVTLCKTKDANQCGGEWDDGWLVFVDKKASGQVDPGDRILQIYPASPPGSFLEWVGQRSNSYLQMEPSGGTHGQAGTFTYYPNADNKQKKSMIIVSQTGRIRIENRD